MEEIELELAKMSSRAEIYMRKGNKNMQNFASGMMCAVYEIQNIILKDSKHIKVLKKIEEEVIKNMGHEGNKIDMELHYDNKLFCRSISNGGRTNNYYFKKVMGYMEGKGYDVKKFEIKVGEEVYIQ